jgi:steroid 5-alpha reductase family enzyme
MSKDERIALTSLPVVILIGIGFALAGSSGSGSILGIPIYAFGVLLAFAIQWIVFIPSFLAQTEKYYDLTGGITYLSVTAVGVIFSPSMDLRSTILAILVAVWAGRLATFLYQRIHKAGKDARFDAVKVSFLRFLLAWTLQGLWVTFTIAAALAAITSPLKKEFGLFGVVGLLIWLFGFIFEAVSDAQKSAFKADPSNKGKYIDTGLWSLSRHPNYFGEIVLWVGVAVIAFPVLQEWQYATLISPIFVALLLTKISGVPILENRADKTWGGQSEYEAYKQRVPVLVPRIFPKR